MGLHTVTLLVNVGSTSTKYALLKESSIISHAKVDFEKKKIKIGDLSYKITSRQHALQVYLEKCGVSKIACVALRLVAPGLRDHCRISPRILAKLRELQPVCPLHIAPVLDEIVLLQSVFKNVKMLAISDSEFHKNIDSKQYAISNKVAKKFDLYRYGYHGLACQSVVNQVKMRKGIICHLGGGSSVTAVLNGKSVDTTMGFSPLEGIMGASRSGSLDISAALLLAHSKGFSSAQLLSYLNEQAGLKGLTGSNDMRKILTLKKKSYKQALEMYALQVAKAIGSFAVSLGGVDTITFSGGVGAGSYKVRKLICDKLEFLGLKLDSRKNMANRSGFIHNSKSKVDVVIVDVDEMGVMARILKTMN